MVYLIATEDLAYAKIGFTDGKLKSRLSILQTGSPIELIIIDSMDGDLLTEKYMHLKCKSFHVKLEWFKYCDELLKIFNESKSLSGEEIRDWIENNGRVIDPVSTYRKIFNDNNNCLLVSPEIAKRTDLEIVDKVVCSYVMGINVNGGECCSSNEHMCEAMGINRLTLVRSIARLKTKGLLLVFNKICRNSGVIKGRILQCNSEYSISVKRDEKKYLYKEIDYSGKYLSRKSIK